MPFFPVVAECNELKFTILPLKSIPTDNIIFKLHYKVTVAILSFFSFVLIIEQTFCKPIDCIVDINDSKEVIPLEVMNAYCWMYSFTTPNLMNGKIGTNLVAPGVGPYVEGEAYRKDFKYYQWVFFGLILQALFFHLPRDLWKMWDAKRLKTLSDVWHPKKTDDKEKPDLKKNDDIKDQLLLCERDVKIRIDKLVDYFVRNLHHQNSYAIQFMICEALNFGNVVAQIYLVDYFLDGEFSTYGLEVLTFTEMQSEERYDPMNRIFPKITKCLFRKYGPSGSLENFDGMCVLPLNALNEKIYVVMWLWFVFLTILSGLCIVYRVAVVICPMLRYYLLKIRFNLIANKDVQIVLDKFQLGDWFVLYQLGKEIDVMTFRHLVTSLAKKLNYKEIR